MNQSFVQNFRQELERNLERIPVPTYKNEDYRHSNPKYSPAEWTVTPAHSQNSAIPESLLIASEDEFAVLAVSTSGKVESRFSNSFQKLCSESGLVFTDFQSFVFNSKKEKELLPSAEEILGVPRVFSDDYFAVAAAARYQSGIVLWIPPYTKVNQTIRALNYIDSRGDSSAVRISIYLGEGSEVSYIDEINGEDTESEVNQSRLNVLVDIYAAPRSKLHYAQFFKGRKNSQTIIRQSIRAQNESQVKFTPFLIAGRQLQSRVEAQCEGVGASIEINGASVGKQSQLCDFWVTATHKVPDTTSKTEYWTVMGERAKAIFNGKIIISESAVRTKASQRNKNLLLSSTAEIITLPKLEIATDDVACSHGASVSSVHDDQLHYLESRGIDPKQAKEMIVHGFTQPVINQIPSLQIQKRIEDVL